MALITRICTVYRQWSQVEAWLGDDALFTADIAWIFVNDAPGDLPSQALLQKLEQRSAQIVSTPRNSGRSLARQAGAELATTEWIEHLDGDDRPLPFPIGEIAESTADLLFFPVCHRGDHTGRLSETEGSFEYHAPDVFLNRVFAPYQPMDWRPCSTVWRRPAFLRMGGYDPRFEPCEDIHLTFRALQAGLVAAQGRTAKQIYSCEGKSAEANTLGQATRLRILRVVADAGLSLELQAAWKQDMAETARLIHWEATELIKTHDRNPRLYFFRESIKHLRQALRRVPPRRPL